MDPGGADREEIRAAIERLVRSDQREGRLRPVTAYRKLFPGFGDVVDEEYERLARPEATLDSPRPPSSPDMLTVRGDAPAVPDASPVAPPHRAGLERIGPYTLVREVGRGGMGVVYLAEDSRLHRSVALKVLAPVYASSRDLHTRFQREAAIAARLDHPGICSVFEAGEGDGIPFIAMRFVHGDTLEQWIQAARGAAGMDVRGPVRPTSLPAAPGAPPPAPLPKASPDGKVSTGAGTREEIVRLVHLVEKACRALHCAHEAGLIHRDIKPGNIMVTREGEPVILDFGLARDEDGTGASITQTGALMGTPAYMSPEQIAAQRIRLDRRTDIYSMGVALYEALTLRLPFTASSRDSLYQRILVSDPENLRKLNPAIPPDLKVVIDKSMEKDRERRYPTALEFAEDLRRVREMEPIRARPAGLATRMHKWVQRNPGVAIPALGAAAMAVVLPPLAFALVQKAREAARLELLDRPAMSRTTSGRAEVGLAERHLGSAMTLRRTGNTEQAREKCRTVLEITLDVPEAADLRAMAEQMLREMGE